MGESEEAAEKNVWKAAGFWRMERSQDDGLEEQIVNFQSVFGKRTGIINENRKIEGNLIVFTKI